MKQQNLAKGLRLLFSAAMIAVLVMSIAPIQTARAEVITSRSDLVLTLVSIPERVNACEIFAATYTITNLGPDPASHLDYNVGIPDAYQDVAIWQAPDSLAVGEGRTFSVIIWVRGFVPGEIRAAHVQLSVSSTPYPNISIDPNLDNNTIRTPMKIIGKHKDSCS